MKKEIIKLNLQMFAEVNTQVIEANKQTESIIYSEDEYNKLKSLLDKVNAENKKFKEEKKASLTAEEQRKIADEEREKEIQNLRLEVNKSRLESELAKGGYDEDEVKTISEHIFSENFNYVDFGKMLSEMRKKISDKITKEVKDEFSKQGRVPDGGKDDTVESLAAEKAKNYGKTSFPLPNRKFGQ